MKNSEGIKRGGGSAGTGAGANRMERRRLQTRARLIEATQVLVIKKGVDKTTLDDITNTADLGRRTLYYHFSSKDECVLAAVAQAYEKHTVTAEQLLSDVEDPVLSIAVAMLVFTSKLVEEPITARVLGHPVILAGAVSQAIHRFISRDVQNGEEAGLLTLALTEEQMATALIWGVIGLMINNADAKSFRDDILPCYTASFLMSIGLDKLQAEEAVAKAAALIKG